MTINESFLLSRRLTSALQDKIFMLPMERIKIRRKKEKRKAITTTTKYYDYEVCLSFWFSTT
jgi:hypothetical protein